MAEPSGALGQRLLPNSVKEFQYTASGMTGSTLGEVYQNTAGDFCSREGHDSGQKISLFIEELCGRFFVNITKIEIPDLFGQLREGGISCLYNQNQI